LKRRLWVLCPANLETGFLSFVGELQRGFLSILKKRPSRQEPSRCHATVQVARSRQ
jgi:hypothetical protein